MTQPKLPGTVPSPEQARANLLAARTKVKAAASDVEIFTLGVKEANAEIAALEAKRAETEDDFEAAEGPSKIAEARRHHRKAVKALRATIARRDALKAQLRTARTAMKLATAERARVEDDLEAIDLGRRPEPKAPQP